MISRSKVVMRSLPKSGIAGRFQRYQSMLRVSRRFSPSMRYRRLSDGMDGRVRDRAGLDELV